MEASSRTLLERSAAHVSLALLRAGHQADAATSGAVGLGLRLLRLRVLGPESAHRRHLPGPQRQALPRAPGGVPGGRRALHLQRAVVDGAAPGR